MCLIGIDLLFCLFGGTESEIVVFVLPAANLRKRKKLALRLEIGVEPWVNKPY